MQPDIAPIVKSQMAVETSTSVDHSSKKHHGRIPSRVHKAEREKMKRGHLNELLLALANSLELSDQKNGKASILNEATRMVKCMRSHIECLRKENDVLLSESQYITVEKNELKDENCALEGEIGNLQTEINCKASELQLALNIRPPESFNQKPALHNNDDLLVFPPLGQFISPSNLATLCSSYHASTQAGTGEIECRHVPDVHKPHARYPTPSDKWPLQVLEKQPELGNELCHR